VSQVSASMLIRREAPQALLGVLGAAGVAFVGAFLIARLLVPHERGHYASIVVFTTLGLVILEMGGEVGVLRGITESDDEGERFLAGYLGWSVLVSVGAGLGVLLLGGLVGTWFRPLWLMALSVAAALYAGFALRIVVGVLLHAGQLRKMIVVRMVGNSGTIIGAVFCLLGGHTSSAEVAAASFLPQAVLNSGFLVGMKGLSFFRLAFRARPRTTAWGRAPGSVWHLGNLQLHLLNCAAYVLQRADQITLSVLGANHTLGLYAVATNVAETVSYVPAAFQQLVVRGRSQQKIPLRKVLLVGAVFVIPLLPVTYFAVPVLYGSAYREAQTAILVLVPAAAFLAAGRLIQGVELRNPAKRMELAGVTIGAALIEFGVLAYLGPGVGLLGAATACLVAYAVFLAGLYPVRRAPAVKAGWAEGLR
jgi:O-antigen/teichoic acid export membrane protein